MRSATIFLFLFFCVCLCNSAPAEIVNWVGGDGDWNTGANWSTGSAPGANDTVNIGVGLTGGVVVTAPTNNIASTMTINLTNNSFLNRPSSVIRLNNANINIESGSGLTGNGFWDLQNADFVFNDGAIVTVANFELKGQNTFRFNFSRDGFTTLTPGTFRNDGNNPASPADLISNETFTADLTQYRGGDATIKLMDFGADAEGMDNAAFQNANFVIESGLLNNAYEAVFQWNDVDHAIELVITNIPEPSSFLLFSGVIGGLFLRRRSDR